MMVRDGQRRLAELLAHFIDGVQDSRLTNEFPFQLAFSGKVHEGNADQHGENPLPGQNQHGDAGRQQHEPDHILEHMTDEPKCGMMVLHPFARVALVKIMRGQSDEDQRNGDQAPDEPNDGKNHHG